MFGLRGRVRVAYAARMNPLKSEDAAFRFLLLTAAVAAVIIGIVLLARAL